MNLKWFKTINKECGCIFWTSNIKNKPIKFMFLEIANCELHKKIKANPEPPLWVIEKI